MIAYLVLFLVIAAVIAYFVASRRAVAVAGDDTRGLHSRPIYHGLNALVYTAVPAFIFILLWLLFEGSVIDMMLMSAYPGADAMTGSERDLLISEIRQVAVGNIFREPTPEITAAVEQIRSLNATANILLGAAVVIIALAGAALAVTSVSKRFLARHSFERSVTIFMIFASTVAILTTIGIVASLLYEAFQFFQRVPVTDFLFGLRWEPQIPLREDQIAGQGAFGAIPVFVGTILVAALAMAVAVPVGILSAIYLTEYASPRFRAVVKPMLEILAGIPTVVYGFFAVLTVAPALRQAGLSLGLDVAPNSAIAAGGVMGIMLIPFISSLSDDAFAAVPQAIRDGSLAVGATKGETIRKVLLPAALPGIVGGVLLALSRAIGETMIVVMAAGLIAKMTVNPLDSVTTVTVQIVTLLIGDSEFDNPKTLAAFALGLMLFIITLFLNLIALRVVRKYREKY
ncbi:phosphate ABC transporter permease subunit PstC [Nitratireductor sp. XY-223]|uniref:phosphate ABC transporter permease subunit PstC n=1 Tax=Nitratireductor sp. XY-223 TaxID=2561926 RepID=UPI0010AB4208|nr:phosphate ABC transporter permease subunit PstC [Nitratireductor sp. XY-223]